MKNKKRILITAGGTLITYHICKIANEYFKDDLLVEIVDTNPEYLVPASTLAYKTHLVPLSNDKNYTSIIKHIIEEENIDVFIPLLPEELIVFSKDSFFTKTDKFLMVAPDARTVKRFADKFELFKTLEENNIPSPLVFSKPSSILMDSYYIVKPRFGFGSQKVSVLKGQEIINDANRFFNNTDFIVQEYCMSNDYDEVTVEVFNYNGDPRIIARRRLATKSGVCVKTELVDNSLFIDTIKVLVNKYDLPIVFNVQFLYHSGLWKLFDFNLRLAAGTPLSTAAGFQLTRAFLSYLLGKEVDESLFNIDKSIKSILRVYEEIVIKWFLYWI